MIALPDLLRKPRTAALAALFLFCLIWLTWLAGCDREAGPARDPLRGLHGSWRLDLAAYKQDLLVPLESLGRGPREQAEAGRAFAATGVDIDADARTLRLIIFSVPEDHRFTVLSQAEGRVFLRTEDGATISFLVEGDRLIMRRDKGFGQHSLPLRRR